MLDTIAPTKNPAIRYYGWVRGNGSDIPILREHGVRGEMTFKADDTSFFRTIWNAVSEAFGVRRPSGVIEHCECTECVMERLIEEWPGFYRGAFTGCLPPYGQDDQLPPEQQKYWHGCYMVFRF